MPTAAAYATLAVGGRRGNLRGFARGSAGSAAAAGRGGRLGGSANASRAAASEGVEPRRTSAASRAMLRILSRQSRRIRRTPAGVARERAPIGLPGENRGDAVRDRLAREGALAGQRLS
jgi:hypothetical protein